MKEVQMEGPSVNAEAAIAPVPLSASGKAEDFENYLFGENDEEEEAIEPEDDGDAPDDGEELELEGEDGDDDAGEPETAIAPPISLNAAEKEVFAQLPKEAQEAWSSSEARRNTQVQEATTKAANAQREAETRAASADAEAKARFGSQLEEIGSAFRPAKPDPATYTDATSYLFDCRQYDDRCAQHDQFMQRVAAYQSEASTEAEKAFIVERDRGLMTIPEIANPETRQEFLDRAMGVATELGFDSSEFSRNAEARDIKALALAAEWKDKAAKYDKAMSRQMQRVRSGKSRSVRPNAAPHADARAANGQNAWQRVKTAKSKESREEAFADFMGF